MLNVGAHELVVFAGIMIIGLGECSEVGSFFFDEVLVMLIKSNNKNEESYSSFFFVISSKKGRSWLRG